MKLVVGSTWRWENVVNLRVWLLRNCRDHFGKKEKKDTKFLELRETTWQTVIRQCGKNLEEGDERVKRSAVLHQFRELTTHSQSVNEIWIFLYIEIEFETVYVNEYISLSYLYGRGWLILVCDTNALVNHSRGESNTKVSKGQLLYAYT